MDLRLLRYFLAIVDTGSVNAASEVVHVAQPSLSRQIRRLESDLNLTLFDRTGKRLVLSAAGHAFLPVARDLLNRAAQAQATAVAISKGTVAGLTVASAPTTVADVISPFIVEAGLGGPIVNVIEASSERIYDLLAAGNADVAVGTRIPPVALSSIVIGRAYLWAQFPASHSLAAYDRVGLRELLGFPLIVLSSDHGVRRMFDAAVARDGLTYTAAFETESPSVAQALAAAGHGVCVISDDSRFDLTVTPISAGDGDLVITLFGVWDPAHYASDLICRFLGDLSNFTARLYPQSR